MNETQLIMRLTDILRDVEAGRITDSQAIKKLMRSHTKFAQSEVRILKEKEE